MPAGWDVSATSSLHCDYYGVGGATAAGPYSSEGTKSYSEFTADFHRQVSAHEVWHGQISGVLTKAGYRSPHSGFVPERLQVSWEKGDFSLPYRLEAGDLFGYFSYRTLQRSLKGVQLEVQPRLGHSLVLNSGAEQSSWRDLEPEASYFNGVSYLIEDQSRGRCLLSLVAHTSQADGAAGVPRRRQYVSSLAAAKQTTALAQELDLEGELGWFRGDHGETADSRSGRNRQELGIYAQLAGKNRTSLTYRVRYEEYGQDFQPAGAAVGYDRRSLEGHLGWRPHPGYQLQSRMQVYRNGLESPNATTTHVLGANLRGGLGFLDTYLQEVENKDQTIETTTRSANLSLNLPRRAGWNGTVALVYQEVDDQAAGDGDVATVQAALSVDHALSVRQFQGTMSPGLGARKINYRTGEAVELYPVLALNLRRADHVLNYRLAYTSQRRDGAGIDVESASQMLDYRFTRARHALGVELAVGRRRPDQGKSTEDLKLGLSWTWTFDRTAAVRNPSLAAPAESFAPSATRDPVHWTELTPGVSLEAASRRLAQADLQDPLEGAGLRVYEVQMLEEIDQRQRLALEHEGGRMRRTTLIIDPARPGDREELLELYGRVRDLLLDACGSPHLVYEPEGPAKEGGMPVRITEWSLGAGVLRLGIPRRQDGQLRLEVQLAAAFPPAADPRWSSEGVR